ncbi:P-loop NTPase [Pseudolysinimonas sp.]
MRSGEYNLFLGAGASLGAHNASGKPLPDGPALVQHLKNEYPNAPIDESTSLQRAYQRAVTASSSEALWRTLKKVFGGSQHQEWFDNLAGYPWRRIWTLNVDDAFESSYRKSLRYGIRDLRVIDWDQDYSEQSELEVIHLHGHIHGDVPSRLVFSFSEYQKLASQRPIWDRILASSVAQKPFVVIGARLLDDIDIESLLFSNPPQHEAPSFVVDPYISDGNRWELEQLGYVVVKVTGEEFTDAWKKAFALEQADLELLYTSTTIDIPQFVKLEVDRYPIPPRTHDFVGGSEPLWADACEKRVARLSWMDRVRAVVDDWLQDSQQHVRVHLVYAERLIGASAGLLEVSRSVRASGPEVVWFDRSSRFDVNLVLDYCRGRGAIVLVIDGVHEFAQDVDKLADLAQRDGRVKIFILLCDRPSRDLKIENQLEGSYKRSAVRLSSHVSGQDARQIVEKLGSLGRLGSIEGLNMSERIRKFTGRDIFSAMAEIELGIGFRVRLDHEIRGLKEQWQRELVFLLALAAFESNQVGVQEASFALGIGSSKIIDSVGGESHLSALVEVSGDLLLPRQRSRTLSTLVESGKETEYASTLARILIGLAPLATDRSLRERNRSAVLVGRLMNAKILRELFAEVDLDEFYEELRPVFGDWNARYWEQRAINAKLSGQWAPAESYAARAVSLYDDSFTRTTYGTILINKATDLAKQDQPAWAAYYERGQNELTLAMGKGSKNRVTSFAYLEATIALLRVLVHQPAVVEVPGGSLSQVIKDWRASFAVMRIKVVDDPGFETLGRVEDLLRQYEQLIGGVEL